MEATPSADNPSEDLAAQMGQIIRHGGFGCASGIGFNPQPPPNNGMNPTRSVIASRAGYAWRWAALPLTLSWLKYPKEMIMLGKAVASILQAIGNTPAVRLNKVVPSSCADVIVKLEYYNPTGSYKDRMALAMIEEAEKRGDLRPGMTVVEYTGGSTGSSLAFVCAVKGYRFRVVSSDAFAKEKRQTMSVFGAELNIVPSQGGKVTPDLVPRMMQRAREIAGSEPSYFTNQLHNADSVKGYEQIGQELVGQIDGPIHAFCGGVGTAGMVMGVAHILRRLNPSPRIIALEPASTPVISKAISGTHHIEGVGIGFVPPLLDKTFFDEARAIDEAEARRMAWRLAREEGIFAGTSTGMNVVGAIALAWELGAGHTVVTVAVDSGLKYLAGDLYGQESP